MAVVNTVYGSERRTPARMIAPGVVQSLYGLGWRLNVAPRRGAIESTQLRGGEHTMFMVAFILLALFLALISFGTTAC